MLKGYDHAFGITGKAFEALISMIFFFTLIKSVFFWFFFFFHHLSCTGTRPVDRASLKITEIWQALPVNEFLYMHADTCL